jgi:hypothetical protein
MTPELDALLKDSSVQTSFRYEVLSKTGLSKGFLDCVAEGGKVTYAYLADIKRTCSFNITEVGNFNIIDFLSDRVKIYCDIYDPYLDIKYAYSLGVFVLTSGSRTANEGVVTREVQGFDLTQVLKNMKHLSVYTVAVDSDPIAIVQSLLTIAAVPHDITPNSNADVSEDTADLVKAERSFDPGSEYLDTINAMLDMVNYGSLYFDENGVARAKPYVAPSDRLADVSYITDDESIIGEGASVSQDISNIPNIVQVVVSQPDRPALIGIARNDNPDSITSTVNVGEKVQSVTDAQDVTTQAQAANKAYSILADASQIFETVEFNTAIVPVHGENSIINITHTDLGISDNYSETNWSITLKAGTYMTHSARKTVTI